MEYKHNFLLIIFLLCFCLFMFLKYFFPLLVNNIYNIIHTISVWLFVLVDRLMFNANSRNRVGITVMLTLNVHVSLFTTLAISTGVAVSFHAFSYQSVQRAIMVMIVWYRSWIYNYLCNQCLSPVIMVVIVRYRSWIYNYLCNQCLSPVK